MDSIVAVGIAGIVASLGGTLGGVYLGAYMSRQTARDLARDEREWTERHAIRQRQDEEAVRLDEQLREALMDLPTVQGPARETGQKIGQARNRMLGAFASSILFDDPEVTRRVHALDLAMLVAQQHAELLEQRWMAATGDPEPRINPWPITVAVGELRTALSCFARHIDPPEAKFPTAQGVLELSQEGGRQVGLEAVMRLLTDRQAPP